MKKKLIGLAIIAPLFLSACSFQEVWGNIKDKTLSLFGQKTKEEKESGTTPGGTTPSDGSTTPTGGDDTTPGGGGDEEVLKTASFDFSELSATNGSSNGFSFTTAKGSGASDPAHNATYSELRLYISNTITFTSSNKIKSISFSANTCDHEKADGSFTVSNGTVSKVSDGFSWAGDTTSVTFTVSSGKQVHINSIAINGGGSGGGGGGGQTEAEFPSSTINTYTESLGSSINLPEFSGTALGYEFDSEYGSLDIEVGQGNEATAVSTYQNDLLGSNNFVEGSEDQYGDVHYISSDNILDVCVWDGNDASTAAPGHIYVDIIEYVEPSNTLPTETINTFLTGNSFGFTITSAIETSINALSNSFVVSETVYDGYPLMMVQMTGSVVEGVNSALVSTLTGAGYTASDETDEGEYYYSNSEYLGVYIYAVNGFTIIELY